MKVPVGAVEVLRGYSWRGWLLNQRLDELIVRRKVRCGDLDLLASKFPKVRGEGTSRLDRFSFEPGLHGLSGAAGKRLAIGIHCAEIINWFAVAGVRDEDYLLHIASRMCVMCVMSLTESSIY